VIFGKYINRYYLKYAVYLLLGLIALVAVDYLQLVIPNLYQMVINGVDTGFVTVDGQTVAFTVDFLLDKICLPMIVIVLCLVVGRFLWRIGFFGAAARMERDLRNEMFDHCKDLSQQYYQINKVGNLMSLFTNDLETVQECFGWGVMMFFDALFLGVLAVIKMFRMDPLLTCLSMIPMALLLASALLVGKVMTKRWDAR
jgi:ATP-binding cassette subfamily B protein